MNRHVPPHDFDTRAEAAGPLEAEAIAPARPAPDFTSARRHSARVRWIKRLVPLSIVLAVVIIGGASLLSRLKLTIELPFDIGHLTLSGSRLTMELPKLSGFTDDNRGYRVTAKTATQDLTRPDVIDLTDIEARLEMADKGWASVLAKTGSFDTKKQFITLGDGVDLAMNGGYGGKLQDAQVDVKAGTIVTPHAVLFTYLDGKLVADRLDVTERGTRALFQGNVQLDFRLNSLPGQKADTPPTGSTTPRVQEAAVPHQQDPAPAAAAHPAPQPAPAPAPLPASAPLPPRRPVPAP
ncbi:hypothetical protein ABLE93_12220 [Xanthobacter sp. KR7-65]|uniref:hypothetical protein n=1 Tax=Xanthobacter sp. KR7-65 TaxID=3156612 RepID=UPI0032B548D4